MKNIFSLIVVLVGTFAFAQESKEDQIIRKLSELQKSLDDIKSSFRSEIDTVKKDLDDNRRDINTLKADVEALKSAKPAAVKKPEIVPYVSPTTTNSLTPVINPNPTSTNSLTQKGTLKVYNWCNQPYNLIINDQAYRIEAYQCAQLDVPAGAFTYKVCGVNPESLIKSILPNDEYRIIINPNQTVSQITKIPPGTYLPNCHP